YPSPNANGICPPDSTLFNGHCLPNEPAPSEGPSEDPRCMPGYWFSETLGVCLPDVTLGCPVGTYFDKYERLCIASGEPTSLTLPGFHFDEASQCSRSDLPSGRYPGCPDGQAYDPSTGSCDFKNIHVDGGKVLQTVKFNFSAPSCEVKDNGGGDDEGSISVDCSQYTTDSTCLAAGCSYDYTIKVCK
ncbi:MAG TPA: hypothetical protein VFI68_12575, partial [Anaerolineales bacterium]|nr:hypothetical protein [Anaerolineales bacterium]